MRTNWITPAVIAAIAAIVSLGASTVAAAQTNPCSDHVCNLVFDWGNGSQAPDIDRKYGAPSELEAAFTSGLTNAGWRFAAAGKVSSMTITIRLTPQNKALCDTMPGVNPDYTCHTVQRAAIVFTPNDSTQKPISRVDINPRCSDPKNFPSFAEFGRYASETMIYTIVNQGKGSRPSVKCQ